MSLSQSLTGPLSLLLFKNIQIRFWIKKKYGLVETNFFSLAPVTMQPSNKLVYMENIGPVCPLTVRSSTLSFLLIQNKFL